MLPCGSKSKALYTFLLQTTGFYLITPGPPGFPGDSSHRTVAESIVTPTYPSPSRPHPQLVGKFPEAPPSLSLFSHAGLFVWAVTSPTSVIPVQCIKPEILHSCFREQESFYPAR